MDNQSGFEKLRPQLWWMIPLTLLAFVLLVTGFDPIGNALGPQAEQIVTVGIMLGVVIYAIYISARGK